MFCLFWGLLVGWLGFFVEVHKLTALLLASDIQTSF